MAVTRRRQRRTRGPRKNYRIDVAKPLILALRDFVLEGEGHIEDVDARREVDSVRRNARCSDERTRR